MAAHEILNLLDPDVENSPASKRARYDLDETNNADRWILTQNELILDAIYDSGVSKLDSDDENDHDLDLLDRKRKIPKRQISPNKLDSIEEIQVLEAALPENTLHKLSLGELENILLSKNVDNNFSCSFNYFDLLSDEVILHIFKKLTKAQLCNVALVCRRFSQLAEDESLWTRMDVSKKQLDPGAMGIILSRQVIILKASKTAILYPPILPNVKASLDEYCCRLMYLDLTMAQVSPESLEMIFSKCKRLKKVSLESVPITDGVLSVLSRNEEMEVLNLAMCLGVNINGLTDLLTNCRSIRELNLAWCYLNSESINYICENLPPTLDRLNLSGCRKILQDRHVATLVTNCDHLRELDLSDCTSITGESVRYITKLQDLNFLAMSRCYAIPSQALIHLKKIKSLAFLDVHGSYIDEEQLRVIKEGLGANVTLNKFKFTSIARPSVGMKTTIWNMRVRD